MLGGQSDALKSIDLKNQTVFDNVGKSEGIVREMEYSQYLNKIMLRGVAVLLTMINGLLFLRMLFG